MSLHGGPSSGEGAADSTGSQDISWEPPPQGRRWEEGARLAECSQEVDATCQQLRE